MQRRDNKNMKNIHKDKAIQYIDKVIGECFVGIGYNTGVFSRRVERWVDAGSNSWDPFWEKRDGLGQVGSSEEKLKMIVSLHKTIRESAQMKRPPGMDYIFQLIEEHRRNNEQVGHKRNFRMVIGKDTFQNMEDINKIIFVREMELINEQQFSCLLNQMQTGNIGEEQQMGGGLEMNEEIQNQQDVAERVECCCCTAHQGTRLRTQCIHLQSTNPNLQKRCLQQREFLEMALPDDDVGEGCFFSSLRCVRKPENHLEKHTTRGGIKSLSEEGENVPMRANSIYFWRRLSEAIISNEEILTIIGRDENGVLIEKGIRNGAKVDALWWPGEGQHAYAQHQNEHEPWFFRRDTIEHVLESLGLRQDSNLREISKHAMAEQMYLFLIDKNEGVAEGPSMVGTHFDPIPFTLLDEDLSKRETVENKLSEHIVRLGGWSSEQLKGIKKIGTTTQQRDLKRFISQLGVKREGSESRENLIKNIVKTFRYGEKSHETDQMRTWQQNGDRIE